MPSGSAAQEPSSSSSSRRPARHLLCRCPQLQQRMQQELQQVIVLWVGSRQRMS
jgi:hypothetical protein